MCGIVGFAAREPVIERAWFVAMRERLAHRGPDAAGVWWSRDGRVGLGHRRLAIIDRSDRGVQPMSDADGRYHLVCNGEIYNYRALRARLAAHGWTFRTDTDVEVILAAYDRWGEDAVRQFDGMFAFALYDRDRRRLLLARDRGGEKPLYFWPSADGFLFASELRALFAHPRFVPRMDPDALNAYLAYGYVSGARGWLEGVKRLPPAHVLTYELDQQTFDLRAYWRPPATSPRSRPPRGAAGRAEVARQTTELTEELESLLGASVSLRLVTSDVPVGVLLSGGLDSSLVAAVAMRTSSVPLRTFTLTFPDSPQHDEAAHARRVAMHIGSTHTEIPLTYAQPPALSEILRAVDEPIADASIVPTSLLAAAIKPHVTVALGGDGGDELFAGYRHHVRVTRTAAWQSVFPSTLRRLAGAFARVTPVGTRGRGRVFGFSRHAPWIYAQVNIIFDAPARARLLTPGFRRRVAPMEAPEQNRVALCDPVRPLLQQITLADFRSFLAEDVLPKVDRHTMAAALEVRSPWLDHHIIDFAFGRVPEHLRADRQHRKILLRQLARRWLPPDFDLDRKQGFSPPLADWLLGPWRAELLDTLHALDDRVFNARLVRALTRSDRRIRRNARPLFALLLLERWRREHRIPWPL